MDCSNVIKLGCFGSCDDIIINDGDFETAYQIRLKYIFNGALRTHLENKDAHEPCSIKANIFNEDYSYLAEISIIQGGANTQCYSFTIKPQA